MREQILDEIRRLTEASGGNPPGAKTFAKETGILRGEWYGVYWARWGDVVAEAGFPPNIAPTRIEEDDILRKFAEAYQSTGKVLTKPEIQIYAKKNKGFPGNSTIIKTFPTKVDLLNRLAEWVKSKAEFADVAVMLDKQIPQDRPDAKGQFIEGSVYLIRSGAYYKIGRSDQLERRVKEIRTALPDAATLVHSIRTDDTAGIEAYWHRRFADRRMNGEWFKLTPSDIAAFKRRRTQ